MRVTIQTFGKSKGVIIPQPLLDQLGLRDTVEIQVEGGLLVLRPPKAPVRQGWAEAARAIAEANEELQPKCDAIRDVDEVVNQQPPFLA